MNPFLDMMKEQVENARARVAVRGKEVSFQVKTCDRLA